MGNKNIERQVYDLISKMDDDEAQMFALHLVTDLVQTDIDMNRNRLMRDQHLADLQVSEDVAKSLDNMLANEADPDEVISIAAAVGMATIEPYWRGEIAKAITYTDQYGNTVTWDPRDHKRDSKGRFSSVGQSFSGGSTTYQGRNGNSDKLYGRPDLVTRQQMTNATLHNQRGKYAETAAQAQGYQRAYGRHANDESQMYGRMELGGRAIRQLGQTSGSPAMATAGLAAEYAGKWGNEGEKVVGPSIRRTAYRMRGTERDPRKTDGQQIEVGRDQTMTVAQIRQVEAESLARSRAKNGNDIRLRQKVAADGTPMFSGRKDAKGRDIPVMERISSYEALDAKGREEVNTRVARQLMTSQLPKVGTLNKLHMYAGEAAPSRGVIITASGEMVRESHGYAEDHYLPFQAAATKELKGGTYVRTRTFGGPTTEDFRTAVTSGAKGFDVISHSGTFHVEFEDDFTGARRNSDKARSMVKSYSKLLDTLMAETVTSQQLSPLEERALEVYMTDIENRARRGGTKLSPSEKSALYDEQRNRILNEDKLSDAEIKMIEDSLGPDASRRDIREAQDAALEEKAARRLRLDGIGYEKALQALEEQYPYFLKDPVVIRPSTGGDPRQKGSTKRDSGYVRPGYLHSEKLLAGTYSEDMDARGVKATEARKRPGTEQQYQNYAKNPYYRSKPAPVAPVDTESTEGLPQGEAGSVADKVSQKIKEGEKKAETKNRQDRNREHYVKNGRLNDHLGQVDDLIDAASTGNGPLVNSGGAAAYLYDKPNLREYFLRRERGNMGSLDSFVERNASGLRDEIIAVYNDRQLSEGLRKMEKTSGWVNRRTLDEPRSAWSREDIDLDNSPSEPFIGENEVADQKRFDGLLNNDEVKGIYDAIVEDLDNDPNITDIERDEMLREYSNLQRNIIAENKDGGNKLRLADARQTVEMLELMRTYPKMGESVQAPEPKAKPAESRQLGPTIDEMVDLAPDTIKRNWAQAKALSAELSGMDPSDPAYQGKLDLGNKLYQAVMDHLDGKTGRERTLKNQEVVEADNERQRRVR